MTKKQKKKLIRIIVSLVMFAIMFILDKTIHLDSVVGGEKYGFLLPLGLYLVVYGIIAYDILFKAGRNIIHGQIFDENFLMIVATIGAFCIKEFSEGVAVMLFYQVGEFFQDYAVNKSRKSIVSLMDIRPDYANVKRGGTIETVDPSEVKLDDIIVVKPGEKIPLDGIVIDGHSTLDTKALTGESLPRDIGIGENVISGTINLTETIEIKVQKEFYDSTVSKILDLVENASSQKSKSEAFITKFAKFYTPCVVFGALLLAVIPGFITGNWSEWVYRALNFLVVSCPCALVISIPLSFFAGIGAASKKGILIKGSNYLEQFSKANIFVFDKTGTLTKGNFAVVGVYPEENKDEILHLALIAENDSNHPIAMSIKKMAGIIKSEEKYQLTDIAGQGIKASNDQSIILCGNEKLMLANNIHYEKPNIVGTAIYVAFNGQYKGCLVIADEIKENAYETIKYINTHGGKSVMLTGDNEQIAKDVASKLELSEYRSSLLPQNKVEEVGKLLKEKKLNDVLCFTGDGINDAPVLMNADIGIAMGGIGQDAAIEAADIVLMHDDLESIIEAKKISNKTIRIVHENIWFALIVKLCVLVLSAIGIGNLWLAVFADVGVSVLAIINAMRANRIK